MELGNRAGVVSLFSVDDELYNLWLTGPSGDPLYEIPREDLPGIFEDIAKMFQDGHALSRDDRNLIKFQTFGSMDESPWSKEGSNFELVREKSDHVIRATSGQISYMMEFPYKVGGRPLGEYMLSRLSTQGSPHVPKMLGMSYWEKDEGIYPWLRLSSIPANCSPAFRSVLSHLKAITDEFTMQTGSRAKRYLVELSRKDHDVFNEALRMGRALGRIHGNLLIDKGPGPDGSDHGISDLFYGSPFSMTDVGTVIGTGSFYVTELKRDFIRLLGEKQKVNPATGRKMKVLKSPLGRLKIEGVDWSSLEILRNHFQRVEKRVRSAIAYLRRFRSSPTIPASLDAHLERTLVDSRGNYIFTGFDNQLFGLEKGKLERFIPLKDLAMVMNSLMKARYLNARSTFRSLGPRVDPRPLAYLFLEYNISKGKYNDMMKDFNVLRIFQGREMPFSFVHKISLVSALWYERMRNSLIEGYIEAITEMDRGELLSYPKGVDTVLGIRSIQTLFGLSSALRSINQGRVSSSAGLESDLLCALSI